MRLLDKLKTLFCQPCVRAFLRHFCIWAPVCLAIFLAANFFIVRHIQNIEAARAASEIYFVKHEGSLKAPLINSLAEAGLTRDVINTVITKLDTVLNMRRLAPRDRYLLTTTEQGDFKLLIVTKDFSRYYVASSGGELVAGIMDITVNSRDRFAKGEIESSLFASMQNSGISAAFILDFTDIFSWAIDFNIETRSGDSYAVLWEEDYTSSGATLNQSIKAAYYDGKFTGKQYAIRFEDEYYDQNGKFTKKMFLKSPISVRGARISSRFTNARRHPVLRTVRPHLGIDYAAPAGTPVEAIGDGVVRVRGVRGGFGNYIEISHPNNYVSCYGHLRSFARGLAVGSKVRQGQTIAYVGSTGLSTGPHLDFRLRQGSKYLDFLNNKNRSSAAREIPAAKKQEFNKIRDEYLKILEESANSAKQ